MPGDFFPSRETGWSDLHITPCYGLFNKPQVNHIDDPRNHGSLLKNVACFPAALCSLAIDVWGGVEALLRKGVMPGHHWDKPSFLSRLCCACSDCSLQGPSLMSLLEVHVLGSDSLSTVLSKIGHTAALSLENHLDQVNIKGSTDQHQKISRAISFSLTPNWKLQAREMQ